MCVESFHTDRFFVVFFRKKTELNVVLNESLNTINKGNGNKVSNVRIIVFHVEAAAI
jgi:hypothetical protein